MLNQRALWNDADLDAAGVAFVSVRDNLDLSTPSGRLMFQVVGTMAEFECPDCKALLTQVGKFWICPQHGQVEPQKPSGPMRIFLSYSHDANEELASAFTRT